MKYNVSVLIPVHRNNELIFESIDSILNQTYKDFEIIVLIDGTNNALLEKINNTYREKINLNIIKITHIKKVIGLTKILNLGIKLSNSTYIARNDYDDISANTRIADQINEFKKNNKLKMVYSHFSYINQSGKIIRIKKPNYLGRNLKNKLMFKNPISHSSVILNRKFILNLGGYNEQYKYSQDFELWSRIVKDNINNVGLIKKCLVNIRIHNQSISSHNSIEQRKNSIIICMNNKFPKKIFDIMNVNKLTEQEKSYYNALVTAYLYEYKYIKKKNIYFIKYLFQIYFHHPSLLLYKIQNITKRLKILFSIPF